MSEVKKQRNKRKMSFGSKITEFELKSMWIQTGVPCLPSVRKIREVCYSIAPINGVVLVKQCMYLNTACTPVTVIHSSLFSGTALQNKHHQLQMKNH